MEREKVKIGPVCRLIFCKEGGLIKEFYIIGFKNKNEIRLMMFEEKKPQKCEKYIYCPTRRTVTNFVDDTVARKGCVVCSLRFV